MTSSSDDNCSDEENQTVAISDRQAEKKKESNQERKREGMAAKEEGTNEHERALCASRHKIYGSQTQVPLLIYSLLLLLFLFFLFHNPASIPILVGDINIFMCAILLGKCET